MIVAGLSPEAIATELGTKRLNIVVAERLFADIRPYLSQRIWLKNAVIHPPLEGLVTPELLRERRLLTAAFEEGPDKLLKILRGNEDASDEALEVTAKKLEALAGRRALEFVRGLDRDGAPVTEDDLRRYILARGMRSREATITAVEQNDKMKAFGLGLVKLLSEPRENWDAKTISGAAKILPVREMKEIMVRRLEERAIEQPQPVESAPPGPTTDEQPLTSSISEPTSAP